MDILKKKTEILESLIEEIEMRSSASPEDIEALLQFKLHMLQQENGQVLDEDRNRLPIAMGGQRVYAAKLGIEKSETELPSRISESNEASEAAPPSILVEAASMRGFNLHPNPQPHNFHAASKIFKNAPSLQPQRKHSVHSHIARKASVVSFADSRYSTDEEHLYDHDESSTNSGCAFDERNRSDALADRLRVISTPSRSQDTLENISAVKLKHIKMNADRHRTLASMRTRLRQKLYSPIEKVEEHEVFKPHHYNELDLKVLSTSPHRMDILNHVDIKKESPTITLFQRESIRKSRVLRDSKKSTLTTLLLNDTKSATDSKSSVYKVKREKPKSRSPSPNRNASKKDPSKASHPAISNDEIEALLQRLWLTNNIWKSDEQRKQWDAEQAKVRRKRMGIVDL